MLSFDIRSLEHHGVAVDGTLAPDDAIWQDQDPRPSGPLHVTGRLSNAGAGRYYWHGRIEGDVVMPCRRCLNDATAHVAGEEHVIFVDADDEEADNPDVYPLDARQAARQQGGLGLRGAPCEDGHGATAATAVFLLSVPGCW